MTEIVYDNDADLGLVTLGRVAAWVRDRGIALECSPSSNLQTGATAPFGEGIENHPFDLLYQTGFKVTINADNRLMSGVTLTDEYELLVETFDYDLDDLLEITLNAAEAAFLPLEEREALVEYIASGSKPREDWRIGTEHEKFGFRLDDLRPPAFDGDRGIEALLKGLQRFGWKPVDENGRTIALLRRAASVTTLLAPGVTRPIC